MLFHSRVEPTMSPIIAPNTTITKIKILVLILPFRYYPDVKLKPVKFILSYSLMIYANAKLIPFIKFVHSFVNLNLMVPTESM
ncbi:unknown [Prevotella sp. CAG:1058]|nr:unknown [Prevotella sp. CAG:1058]